MTYHTWGDDWPHWETLQKAGIWIHKEWDKVKPRNSKKITLMMKEKYGTLRYEILPMQCTSNPIKDGVKFLDIVTRATRKFPEVMAEIVDDLVFSVGFIYDDIQQFEYYIGYFRGIMIATGNEELKENNL